LRNLPSVKDAAFDSFSDQLDARCHPGTRIELRHQIIHWSEDPSGKPMFWLNGMAGTGKSTVSRTIAQAFHDTGRLGASFFFKRGEGDRGNASKFFTTIASQMARRVPRLAPYIKAAVDGEPEIGHKSLQEQFEKLILTPLSKMEEKDTKLIVIDALDECENIGHVRMIINLFSQFSKTRIRVYMTSRPEFYIRLGFKEISKETYQDFILQDIPPQIIKHDITAFIETELERIRKQNSDRLPSDWPGEKTIQQLVNMAVPLFIFAATICRFISDPRWNPNKRLLNLLEYQIASQADRLDGTYLPVLDQLLVGLNNSDRESMIAEFQYIIGSMIVLANPLSARALANLLDIEKEIVDYRLDSLNSVLVIPIDDSPVRILHLSFHDFLLDRTKCGKNPFWVDEQKTHAALAVKCLDLLMNTECIKEDICNLKKLGIARKDIDSSVISTHLPAEVQYACSNWAWHLTEGKCKISDKGQVHSFLETKFLYWLEALSLMGKIHESIGMVTSLQPLLEVSKP
jgi:hypothetical protein